MVSRRLHASASESVACECTGPSVPDASGKSGRFALSGSGEASSRSLIPLIDKLFPALLLLVCLRAAAPIDGDPGTKAWNPSDCKRASMSRAISAVSSPPAGGPSMFKAGNGGLFSALGLGRRARRLTEASPFRSFSSKLSRTDVSSSALVSLAASCAF